MCTQNNNNFDPFLKERKKMVEEQIEKRGIYESRVLKAFLTVPRHFFVPNSLRELSYQDSSLPIGHQQTISQPYIVALMSEASQIKPKNRVLEIGTGSGYQAAILSEMGAEVYSIEVIEPLAEQAKRVLKELGYTNIHIKVGDGYEGWPEASPFDAIIMTARSSEIPQPLLDQLKVGGHLVMPLEGKFLDQMLVKITKTEGGILKKDLIPVSFVPLVRP